MAKRKSAGILLYRDGAIETEVFLVLHGGPFWVGKDAGAWSIPKGEFDDSETPLQAAMREFQEETGILPHNPLLFQTYDLPANTSDGAGARHFFLSVFRVEADALSVAIAADDAADIGWYTADEIFGLPIPDSVRECVEKLEALRQQ